MVVTPVATHKITIEDTRINDILNRYLPKIKDRTIVAVSSKIIAICQGRVVPIKNADKDALIHREAEYYLPREENPFKVSLTITNNILVPTAGIDESNGNGYYILWPKDPQKSANDIRGYLKSSFSLTNIGVIITDSKTTPLRWGVTGIAIAYSGFFPLKSYIGKDDVFGRKLEYTQTNIMDSLATSATVVMGEGSEQTPLAIISDLPFVEFHDRNPTEEELASLKIAVDQDLYTPLLKSVAWKKGKAK